MKFRCKYCQSEGLKVEIYQCCKKAIAETERIKESADQARKNYLARLQEAHAVLNAYNISCYGPDKEHCNALEVLELIKKLA